MARSEAASALRHYPMPDRIRIIPTSRPASSTTGNRRTRAASNRRAALTTVAFYQAAYPDLHLFRGRLFFLGGSTELQALAGAAGSGPLGGDRSGIAAREVPSVLRPYTFPPLDLALLRDWDGRVDSESPAACVFELFTSELCVRVAQAAAPKACNTARDVHATP